MSLATVSRGLRSLVCTQPSFKGALVRHLSSDNYKYETLSVTEPHQYVIQVEFNRPEKRNAFNFEMCRDMLDCFNKLSEDGDCRSIVLSGAGKGFSAGIDLMVLAGGLSGIETSDVARRAFAINKLVWSMQQSLNVMDKCEKPVIAAIHGAAIGIGLTAATACDIRYCTEDAKFSVKEAARGLAADIGTLQRLPRIIGNDSMARELSYTARDFSAGEAKEYGLVSRVFADRDSLLAASLELAKDIASKSPVAVRGTKVHLNYSRDHSVQDGLDYVRAWNAAMLQGEDLMKAAAAAIQKEEATFDKL